MAFFAMWALGLLICLLAAIFLYKNVVALKDSIQAQMAFRKVHSDAILASSNMGWVWFDILLAFVAISFATQAGTLNEADTFAPEALCFIGIAIFCAGKAVSRWNEARMVFYKQGLFYKTEDIPFSTIRKMEPYGSQFELEGKKQKYMISKRQASEIEKRLSEWKSNRKNRKK